MERARGLAGVRRPRCPSARYGGDESTVTPVSVYDHQLGTRRLQRGDGDGWLGAAVVRLVYSGKHAEHWSTEELHLLEPLDATAPLADHMLHELRRLGYTMAVGWVVRPPAAGDETIYGAYMREAGIAGRTETEIARLQRWRREHNVLWVSEMFKADGTTRRDRFMTNLVAHARRCEPDTIRRCNIAFGRGRGPNQSGRPRVGFPTPAAWKVVGVGSYVWHGGVLGRVRAKGHADATIAVFTADVAPRRITARANVKFTMRRSEVVHYDSPPLLVDTASSTTSGCVHARHHEV